MTIEVKNSYSYGTDLDHDAARRIAEYWKEINTSPEPRFMACAYLDLTEKLEAATKALSNGPLDEDSVIERCAVACQAESSRSAIAPTDYAEAVEMLKRVKSHMLLMVEVRDALFNLAPRFRERDCFGDRQSDCGCTACKLKRAIEELETL